MRTALIGLALVAAAASVTAQTAPVDHSSHGQPAPAATMGPADAAYREASARMHSAMDIPLTGDADVDFIQGMIPHHQGAVDMARIVLEHGSDPEVRKLAEAVITAQEAEIAWMQGWLAARGR